MKKFFLITGSCILSLSLHAQTYFSTDKMTLVPFTRNASSDKLINLHKVDLNNDGFTDIVADGNLKSNESGYIEHSGKPVLFVNDRHGNLIPTPTPFMHTSTSSMISDIADYNNDGFQDLVVYDFWGNNIRLYKGVAGFNFTLVHTFYTGTHGAKGYFEDLDNDGDLDIYNVNSGSGAEVFLHVFTNNAGSFTEAVYGVGTKTLAPLVWAKDVNHDGRKDIIALTGSGLKIKRAFTWIQKPDHTFESLLSEEISAPMRFGAFGSLAYGWDDLNKDGFQDLTFLDDWDDDDMVHTNAVYTAMAPPYFDKNPDLSGPALALDDLRAYSGQTMITGDINKDSVMDIVTCARVWDPATSARMLKILIDPFNKKGNFFLQTLNLGITDITTDGYGLLLADLENDHDLELISLGKDDTLRIFGLNPIPTGISTPDANTQAFTLYPNPATDKLFIDIGGMDKNTIATWKIYTTDGRLLRSEPAEAYIKGVSIDGLASGHYLLTAEMNNGDSYGKIFVKQ